MFWKKKKEYENKLKDIFLENIKTIPIKLSEIKDDYNYKMIFKVIELTEKQKMKKVNKLTLDLLNNGIKMLGKETEDYLVKYFLAISEIPKTSDEIRSFAIDTMLVAEENFYGEYKSKEELLISFNDLKKKLL